MKKCIPPISDRILTVLVPIFCAVVAFLAFRGLIFEEQSFAIFFVGLFFGGVSIYTFWRMCYMCYIGNWGFFYNEEKIIFVLSRKDRREFRWEELQNAQENANINICYQSSPETWNFYLLEKKETKHLLATPRMTGYDEFIATLKKKKVSAQECHGPIDFDKKMADEIYYKAMGEHLYKEYRHQK